MPLAPRDRGYQPPRRLEVKQVADQHPLVLVERESRRDVPMLTMQGVLDSSTYRTIRDTVIKVAIDEPRAVIVDVDRLHAPSASAWTVFSSARWHVSV